jgi:hypothetical protein
MARRQAGAAVERRDQGGADEPVFNRAGHGRVRTG